MLYNYLKIVFRNLWNNKLYSALNISGLSLGLTACLVIYTITSFGPGFDTFHPDSGRIYRIDIQWWMFALAGITAAGIAFLTIGFQSIRAALTDPVVSLRSE